MASKELNQNFREAIKQVLDDYDSVPARGFCPHIYTVLNNVCECLVKKSTNYARKNNGFLSENDILHSINEVFPENLKRRLFQKMISNQQTFSFIQTLDRSVKNQIIMPSTRRSTEIQAATPSDLTDVAQNIVAISDTLNQLVNNIELVTQTQDTKATELTGRITEGEMNENQHLGDLNRENTMNEILSEETEMDIDNTNETQHDFKMQNYGTTDHTQDEVTDVIQNIAVVTDTVNNLINNIELVTQAQHPEETEITDSSTAGIEVAPMDVNNFNGEMDENQYVIDSSNERQSFTHELLLTEMAPMNVDNPNEGTNETVPSNEMCRFPNVQRNESQPFIHTQIENRTNEILLEETEMTQMDVNSFNRERNENQYLTNSHRENDMNELLPEQTDIIPVDSYNPNVQRNERQPFTLSQTENSTNELLLEETEVTQMDVDNVNERQPDFQKKDDSVAEFLMRKWYYFLPFFPFLSSQ